MAGEITVNLTVWNIFDHQYSWARSYLLLRSIICDSLEDLNFLSPNADIPNYNWFLPQLLQIKTHLLKEHYVVLMRRFV